MCVAARAHGIGRSQLQSAARVFLSTFALTILPSQQNMATLLASLQHSKLVRTRVLPGSTTMYQVVYTRVRTYVGYYELGWDRNQAADQRVHAVVAAIIHENDDSSRGSNG